MDPIPYSRWYSINIPISESQALRHQWNSYMLAKRFRWIHIDIWTSDAYGNKVFIYDGVSSIVQDINKEKEGLRRLEALFDSGLV